MFQDIPPGEEGGGGRFWDAHNLPGFNLGGGYIFRLYTGSIGIAYSVETSIFYANSVKIDDNNRFWKFNYTIFIYTGIGERERYNFKQCIIL